MAHHTPPGADGGPWPPPEHARRPEALERPGGEAVKTSTYTPPARRPAPAGNFKGQVPDWLARARGQAKK